MSRITMPVLLGVGVMLAGSMGCSKASDTAPADTSAASPTATTPSATPAASAPAASSTGAAATADAQLADKVPLGKNWKISTTGKKLVFRKLPSGVLMADIKVGKGATPNVGQTVLCQYTGVTEQGVKFDSSYDHGGSPIPFPIGVGQVIKGWDQGVITMKVGGKRRLWIPAALAYGSNSPSPSIPANANLIFDVELVGIQ